MINDEQLHKWVNGKLTKEELEVFKLRPEYDSLVELYKNTEGLSAPNFDDEKMLAKILKEEKTNILPEKGRRVFLSSWVKYGVAASVLFLAVWLFWPDSSFVQYDLAKGERTEGTLPDGSTFVLNAESTLSFNTKTWETDRNLDLEGEAFFSVKKGSKFSVRTPHGTVQVLGTKFNVRSRNNTIEVKCQTGKVAVLDSNGNVFGELIANDAIRISNGKDIEKWEVSPTENASWVDGIFRFKNVSLEVVLAELERQFDVKIDAGKIDLGEQISCNFQIKDLDLAFKTVLSPLGISYEKQGIKNIILKK